MPAPPPAPPPPPPPGLATTGGADRCGLLNEIGNFRKGGLRKAVTNDRSAPVIGGSSNATTTTTNNNNNNNNSNNTTRTSLTNRPKINDRPSTTPLITANQLTAAVLKPAGPNVSTVKVRKPSIPQFAPPPPIHQPVVKTSLDQIRSVPQQIPRLPPREPPPPPPNENKPKLSQLQMSSTGSQQKITRAPPPPPPPYCPGNNGHSLPDTSSRLPKSTNSNAPPPPPPPPRGVIPNGIMRRTSSDFVDHSYTDRRSDQSSNFPIIYDQNFEARFRFTPLEDLPVPDRWQPSSNHSRSSKHHVNVR